MQNDINTPSSPEALIARWRQANAVANPSKVSDDIVHVGGWFKLSRGGKTHKGMRRDEMERMTVILEDRVENPGRYSYA